MGEVRVEGGWNIGTLPALQIPVLNVSRAMSCKQALTWSGSGFGSEFWPCLIPELFPFLELSVQICFCNKRGVSNWLTPKRQNLLEGRGWVFLKMIYTVDTNFVFFFLSIWFSVSSSGKGFIISYCKVILSWLCDTQLLLQGALLMSLRLLQSLKLCWLWKHTELCVRFWCCICVSRGASACTGATSWTSWKSLLQIPQTSPAHLSLGSSEK